MKKCIKCGKIFDSKFCPDCGAEMFDIAEDTSGTIPNNYDQQYSSTGSYNTGAATYRFASDSNTTGNFRDNSYNINETKEGVSDKTWFVILFLVIFWPVGLALMWSKKKFNLAARIIITVIIALLAALNIFFIFNEDDIENDYYSDQVHTDLNITSDEATSSGETSLGQENALQTAKDYLDILSFSYSGLVDQLEYEGYTHEEAVYAADNCGADWNQQAAFQAKSYLDIMNFSRQELIEQLEYDGFTSEQAEYGVKAAGY